MSSLINRYDYLQKYVCTEAKEVTRYVFLYRDVFSFKLVYEMMRFWFQNKGYSYQGPYEVKGSVVDQTSPDRIPKEEDFPETTYLHKESDMGTEVWLRWRCQKLLPQDPYWGFEIDLDVHVLGLNPAEVVINGKKIKADKGEIEVTCVATLLQDVRKKVSTHPLLKHFYNFLFNVYYGDRITELEVDLENDAHDLKKALKDYFKLPTYDDQRELTAVWPRRDET